MSNGGHWGIGIRVAGIAATILISFVLLVVVQAIPGPASAREALGTSGTINFSTASYEVGAGQLQLGDILWWSWQSTDNVTFAIIRLANDSLITGLESTQGFIVTSSPGGYILKWWNNNYPLSSATIMFQMHAFTPTLGLTSPGYGKYMNSTQISVRGSFDGFATGVAVGTDLSHLSKASLVGDNWTADKVAIKEGPNIIFAKTYYWLDSTGKSNYSLTATVQVFLDTTTPRVSISAPHEGTSIRGGSVDVLWNASDPKGIQRVDLRIDSGDWYTVHWGLTWGEGYDHLVLPSGKHTINVRAVDIAGNQAISSTTFRTDSRFFSVDGPYYGLPLLGIIAAAFSVASYIAVLSRSGAARHPPPESPKPQ